MSLEKARTAHRQSLSPSELLALRGCIDAAVEELGLVSLEVSPAQGVLKITLESPSKDPSLDEIAEASKAISRALDELNGVALLDESYELEVSSPGIERPLLSAAHFVRHTGALVDVRLTRGTNVERFTGRILEASTDGVRFEVEESSGLSTRELVSKFSEIQSAKTIFEWPGAKKKPGTKRIQNSKSDASDLQPTQEG